MDPCCHPGPFGHRWLAMVLLYNLEKEIKIMDAMDREAVLNEDRFDGDFSAFHLKGPTEKLREFWMPMPWRMTQHESEMYCDIQKVKTFINFMQNAKEPVDLDKVIAKNDNGAWTHYADSKNKTGLISTTAPSHVSMEVIIDSPRNILKIFYLLTKDGNNAATALIWVDYEASNGFADTYCNKKDTEYTNQKQFDHQGSEGNTTVFVLNSQGGGASIGTDKTYLNVLPVVKDNAKYLHFCVLTKNNTAEAVKFKILSLSTK